MTYLFLQHYWWFLVSLLGALLVFLLFVQGANSMIAEIVGQLHWPKVGTDFHDVGYFWRCFLRLFPLVLQHQFWRCLLVVDGDIVHVCLAGGEL